MSSILDALEKLESRRAQASAPEPPRRARRSVTPLLAGAAVTAFAAGIGITVVWLRPVASVPSPSETAVPMPAPGAVPAPVMAPPAAPPTPSAAAAPAVAAPAPHATLAPPRPVEQPWAEVVTPPDARTARNSADAPPAAAAAVADAPPAAAAMVARLPARERPADRAEPEAAVAVPTGPARPPTTPPPAAPRPAGAPAVRVSFLVYSGTPERRSVALTIDGGLVTLHEGEAAGGVSVAQILPDGVELTWEGQAFHVPARD